MIEQNIKQNYKFLEDNKELFYSVIGYAFVFIWNSSELIQNDLSDDLEWTNYKISFILSLFAAFFHFLSLIGFMLTKDRYKKSRRTWVVYTFLLGIIIAAASLFGLALHVMEGMQIDYDFIMSVLTVTVPIVVLTVILIFARLKFMK